MLFKVKCKNCKAKVLSGEWSCPQCGAQAPGKGKHSLAEIAIAVSLSIGLVYSVVTVGGWINEWNAKRAAANAAEAAEEARVAAEKEAACRADLQCWGDKNAVVSDIACAPAVERLAKYSARWTADAALRFPKFKWRDPKNFIVSYVGDNIEFQNGYGAYQAMTYVCDYDPVHNQVLDVRVKPGRL